MSMSSKLLDELIIYHHTSLVLTVVSTSCWNYKKSLKRKHVILANCSYTFHPSIDLHTYITYDVCYEITVPLNMRFLNVKFVDCVPCTAAFK
jgi:hypothetical protein